VSASRYLLGYPPELLARANDLLAQGRLGQSVLARYPQGHDLRTEAALYDFVNALKRQFMRSAPPLAKVAWDPRLQLVQQALGTHTTVSRVQGGRLKTKREIHRQSLQRRRRHSCA
jgi:predicted metal-dependent hydrolase